MELQNKNKNLVKIFWMLLLIVIIQNVLERYSGFWGLVSKLMSYVIPFIYAFFFGILIIPIAEYFEKKLKQKRKIAVTISYILVILFCVGLVLAILPGITSSINKIIEQFPTFQEYFIKYSEKALAFLVSNGIQVNVLAELKNRLPELVQANSAGIIKFLSSSLMSIIAVFGQMTMGLFLSIFFVAKREYFGNLIFNIILVCSNKEKATSSVKFLENAKNIFLDYLFGKIIASLVVGVIAFLIMFFANVPYALLISILLALGNLVPYVGGIVAMVIGAILVLVESPNSIWWLLIANFVAQQADGLYISPKIVGEKVGMSFFWVLTAVILGGAFGGILGMIFGVPILAVIKQIFNEKVKESLNKE